MNILKVQNDLKSVPDNALIGYVQNPTGQVPSYLALSELQRRKEMRADYQAQKPETSTVAQDLEQQAAPQPQAGLAALPTQQAAPQAGVAGLPVPDQMFSGKGMAQGGIVAFDDGGEVQHYDGTDGSVVQADTPASRIDTMYKLLSGAPYKFYRGLAESTANVPYEAVRSQFPGLPENVFHKNVFGGEPGAGLLGTSKPVAEQPVAPAAPTADTTTGAKPAADVTKPAPVAEDPFAGIRKSLAVPTEKARSLKDYAADYTAALGTDPTLEAAKTRIASMEAKADAQEKTAGWMSLAKAGLAMAAGKSPHALQNIAEGATAGVTDYQSAQEKLAQLREKHFELQSQLDRQARAEKVSAITYGANSKEHQEDRASREKLENKTLGTQLAIAQLNYGLNAQTKLISNRKDAEASAAQAFKLLHPDAGIMDSPELNAEYNKLLAQKFAELGVTPGTAINTTGSGSSGTLQQDKSGGFNYIKGGAK